MTDVGCPRHALIEGQTQEDGTPAPGSVRLLHRADVHIIEPEGSEVWLDVRIHAVGPGSEPIFGKGMRRSTFQ